MLFAQNNRKIGMMVRKSNCENSKQIIYNLFEKVITFDILKIIISQGGGK